MEIKPYEKNAKEHPKSQVEFIAKSISRFGWRKKHPLYRKWVDMKTRCYNKKYSDYLRYGGRGIKVCDDWVSSFDNFYMDMVSQYEGFVNTNSGKPTLDRIDNNGHYSQNNCRWITQAEQNRNYSKNRILTAHGKTMILKDWGEYLNIPTDRIYARIKLGWTLEKALCK